MSNGGSLKSAPGQSRTRREPVPNRKLTSVAHVELDAEVSVVLAARVVRRRQDNAAVGLPLPDDARHGRRRHDAALTDDQTRHL